jgi:ADP-heptose:LPS heptosyltransferase
MTSDHDRSMVVIELWGLGDVTLALPFLQAASARMGVTLLAKPPAASLLRRFAPKVELIPCEAPWTAFSGKYQLGQWPWRKLADTLGRLRATKADVAVSARPDPRDHGVMMLAGARRRYGFPRAGSSVLLTNALKPPPSPHRADHWSAIAGALGWPALPTSRRRTTPVRRVVLHLGAGHTVRIWPVERFAAIATRLRAGGLEVITIDSGHGNLERLLDTLESADAFIGNDSGPGHLAALFGLPTFTVFGPQLPERFAPVHPQARWIEGLACPHKPCFDRCRYASPHCILGLETDQVDAAIRRWLQTI